RAELTNPGATNFFGDLTSSFSDFVRTIRTGATDAVDALLQLGEHLADLALEDFVVKPAEQAIGGYLKGLVTGPANDNGAATAAAAVTSAATASISVGAATINVAGGVGGALGLG